MNSYKYWKLPNTVTHEHYNITHTFSWLGCLALKHQTAVRQVKGSIPGFGKDFYFFVLLKLCWQNNKQNVILIVMSKFTHVDMFVEILFEIFVFTLPMWYKKRRNSTIQPTIDMTGIRNERWQRRKNDAVILVALVACTKFGVNRPKQTKVMERKLNFFF